MRKKTCLLVAVILMAATTHAQKETIDSLRNIVHNSPEPDALISACINLSAQLNLSSFDENIEFARKGIDAAIKKNDSVSLAKLYRNLGMAHYFKGKFDSAAFYYYKCVDIFSSKKQLNSLASVYNDLGKLYRKIGPYSRAQDFYDKALRLYTQLKDKNGIATIYNEAGVLYEYEGKFDDAIKSYKASLELCKELNDDVGIAYSLNFIAGVYVQQKKFAEAEEYNTQALNIREKLKDSFTIALTYTDFGGIYSAEKKYDKAEESYAKSNKVAIALGYADLLRNNYSELSNIASAKGDYKKALEYFQQSAAYKDSIYKTETSKQVEELSARYDTAEKEKQIQQQQFEITTRNYWIAGISGLLLLGSLLGYSYYNRFKLKQQARLQTEILKQQDLATKAVIEAEEKERKRIAGDLHDGVGQMMSAARMNLSAIQSNLAFTSEEQRNNFEKVVGLIDESCQEVRTVSHNMMPNALLKSGLASAVREFLDKIDQHIIKISMFTEGLNERIDSNVETVLYRVIQECVNNVIKHSKAGELDISLIKDADGISATIEDNGKGFDVTDTDKFNGIGLKNIKSRIDYLKGTVEWDSTPGNGTLVAIHVPVNK